MVARKRQRKRSFRKGSVSKDAKRRQQGSQYGHLRLPNGVSIFDEEPSTRVRLDIMPYEVTDENHPDRDDEYEIAVPGFLWYKRPYWLHRNIGPSNDAVVCPTSAGRECPICDHRAQLLKDGVSWDDDSVRALKASLRNLYVVIPIGHKKYEEKPHIWDISQYLFQDQLDEEVQENEQYELFPDLEEGFTLRIRFGEGQFAGSTFAETSRIDFEERDAYPESILDEIPDLDEVLIVPSTKKVEGMFYGGVGQDEVEDEERGELGSGYEEEVEGEIEEEPDQPDEPEEEPEEKPKRTRRRTPPKKEEEKTEDSKCPFDHEFGTDCDRFDDCDECDDETWEACMDASAGL